MLRDVQNMIYMAHLSNIRSVVMRFYGREDILVDLEGFWCIRLHLIAGEAKRVLVLRMATSR